MTRSWCFLIFLVIALAGCGGGRNSPEKVVRAWSAAVNRGDNGAAAALFGAKVEILAGDHQTVFHTHAQSLAFHRSLGWCGPIVMLAEHEDEIVARFSLASRTSGHCERGGRERGTVAFRIRDGKIIRFEQIGE
jgi:hypothetical protein